MDMTGATDAGTGDAISATHVSMIVIIAGAGETITGEATRVVAVVVAKQVIGAEG